MTPFQFKFEVNRHFDREYSPYPYICLVQGYNWTEHALGYTPRDAYGQLERHIYNEVSFPVELCELPQWVVIPRAPRIKYVYAFTEYVAFLSMPKGMRCVTPAGYIVAEGETPEQAYAALNIKLMGLGYILKPHA